MSRVLFSFSILLIRANFRQIPLVIDLKMENDFPTRNEHIHPPQNGTLLTPISLLDIAGSSSNTTAGSSSSSTIPDTAAAGKSVTWDVLHESLVRHKRLAFRLVLSCLAPVLADGTKLPTMTDEDILAAEKKRRLEEGGTEMLERPPESFREAVLPDYLRHKAQFEYKVCPLWNRGGGLWLGSGSGSESGLNACKCAGLGARSS